MIWYDATTEPPPFGVKVIADWAGETLEAARILHAKWRCAVWGVIVRGTLQIRRSRPDRWRPLGRPVEPVALNEPPIVKSPSASEIEAVEPQWWRQPGSVAYSTIGITPREAEGRIMRAIWTDYALDDGRPTDDTPLTWLARMIAKREIEMGIRERATFAHDRFQPTGRDIADHAVVMTWLVGLGDRRRIVLGMRAVSPPYSWRQIGDELDVTRERAREIYRDAMVAVTRRANAATLAT